MYNGPDPKPTEVNGSPSIDPRAHQHFDPHGAHTEQATDIGEEAENILGPRDAQPTDSALLVLGLEIHDSYNGALTPSYRQNPSRK